MIGIVEAIETAKTRLAETERGVIRLCVYDMADLMIASDCGNQVIRLPKENLDGSDAFVVAGMRVFSGAPSRSWIDVVEDGLPKRTVEIVRNIAA